MAQPLAKPLYTAHATATGGGRDGHVATDDKQLDFDLKPPKELGGPGGTTNPEQLFAAGYAACFASALAHVARSQKLTTGPVEITVTVHLGAVGQGFGLQAAIAAKIPELPRDQAQKLLEAAHQVCPYSNATRGNIVVDLELR